ncbi:putative Endonuclease/exonuclease/phosphatase superfamily [Helianthus anomalus]
MWVIMGDFNSVRFPEERYNTEFIPSCAEAFNEFVEDNSLLEYPMGGRKYTRISDAGDKLSKLDRFLVSSRFGINGRMRQ